MAALGVGRVGPTLTVGQVCSAQPLGRAEGPSPGSEPPYKLSQHCLGHSPLRWPALFSSRLAATWFAATQRTLELHDCPDLCSEASAAPYHSPPSCQLAFSWWFCGHFEWNTLNISLFAISVATFLPQGNSGEHFWFSLSVAFSKETLVWIALKTQL